MEKRPPITVFLPTYNRPDYTREALASCLKQTHAPFRVIVSDDTPSDAVRRVVEEARSGLVEYTHNDPPLGLVGKLNRFLENCPTEWAVILGDDDSLEPAYLEKMAGLIGAYPQANLIRTRYRILDPSGAVIKVDEAEKRELDPFEAFASYFKAWDKIHINISGVLFKPAVMRAAGGFPDYYQAYHTDTVAWAALAAVGGLVFYPEPLVNLRLFDPTSLSSKLGSDFVRVLALEKTALAQTENTWRRLKGRARSRAQAKTLRRARAAYHNFFGGVTFHYADAILKPLLREPVRNRETIVAVLDGVNETRLRTPLRFGLYRRLCFMPEPLSRAALGLIERYRKLAVRVRGARPSAAWKPPV